MVVRLKELHDARLLQQVSPRLEAACHNVPRHGPENVYVVVRVGLMGGAHGKVPHPDLGPVLLQLALEDPHVAGVESEAVGVLLVQRLRWWVPMDDGPVSSEQHVAHPAVVGAARPGPGDAERRDARLAVRGSAAIATESVPGDVVGGVPTDDCVPGVRTHASGVPSETARASGGSELGKASTLRRRLGAKKASTFGTAHVVRYACRVAAAQYARA